MGHLAYRCPNKPNSSSGKKRVAYTHEDARGAKSSEVDHTESEMGEILMFNMVLIRQPVKDEPKHRRALFKVQCKILGKVCKVIVDSGSIDNIISKEAVNKLKLTKIPHVNPYKVTWLNKGQSVLMNEKTWVDVLSSYKDKLICDVLPMDACHLLLGRP